MNNKAKQLSSLLFGNMSLEIDKVEDFPEIHFNETELKALNEDFSDEDGFTLQTSKNTTVYTTINSISKFTDNIKESKIKSFFENKENVENSRFITDNIPKVNFGKGDANSLQESKKVENNELSYLNDLADTKGIQEENMIVRDSLLSFTSNDDFVYKDNEGEWVTDLAFVHSLEDGMIRSETFGENFSIKSGVLDYLEMFDKDENEYNILTTTGMTQDHTFTKDISWNMNSQVYNTSRVSIGTFLGQGSEDLGSLDGRGTNKRPMFGKMPKSPPINRQPRSLFDRYPHIYGNIMEQATSKSSPDVNGPKPSSTIQNDKLQESSEKYKLPKAQGDLNFEDIIKYNKKLSLMSQKIDECTSKNFNDNTTCSKLESFKNNDTSKVFASNTNERTPLGNFRSKKTHQQNMKEFENITKNNINSNLSLFLNSLNSTGSLNKTNNVDLNHFISLLPDAQEPDVDELFKIIMELSKEKEKSCDADISGINRVSFGAMCFNNIGKIEENQNTENTHKNKAGNVDGPEERKTKKLNLSVIKEDEANEKGQEGSLESVTRNFGKCSIDDSNAGLKNKNIHINDYEKQLVDSSRLPSLYFKEDSQYEGSYATHALSRRRSNHDSLNANDLKDENCNEYNDVETGKDTTSQKLISANNGGYQNKILEEDKLDVGYDRNNQNINIGVGSAYKNIDEERFHEFSFYQDSKQNPSQNSFSKSLESINLNQSKVVNENKLNDPKESPVIASIKLNASQQVNNQQQQYINGNFPDSSSNQRNTQLDLSKMSNLIGNSGTQQSQKMIKQSYSFLYNLQPSYDVTMECSALEALPVNHEESLATPVPLNDSCPFKDGDQVITVEKVNIPPVCCVRVPQVLEFLIKNLSYNPVNLMVFVSLAGDDNNGMNNSAIINFDNKLAIPKRSSQIFKLEFTAKIVSTHNLVVSFHLIHSRLPLVPVLCHICMESEEPMVEVISPNNSVYFGRLACGTRKRRIVSLVNKGRSSVPLQLSIAQPKTIFFIQDACHADQTVVLSFQKQLMLAPNNAKVDKEEFCEEVTILCQTPDSILASELHSDFRAYLKVNLLDHVGTPLTSLPLVASFGVVKLKVSPNPLELSNLMSKCVVNVMNVGSMVADVRVDVESCKKHISVAPEHVMIEPGGVSGISVKFHDHHLISYGSHLNTCLGLIIEPEGTSYDVPLSATVLDYQVPIKCDKMGLIWIGDTHQSQSVLLQNLMDSYLKLTLQIVHSAQFQMQVGDKGKLTSERVVVLEPLKSLTVPILFQANQATYYFAKLYIRVDHSANKYQFPLYAFVEKCQIRAKNLPFYDNHYVAMATRTSVTTDRNNNTNRNDESLSNVHTYIPNDISYEYSLEISLTNCESTTAFVKLIAFQDKFGEVQIDESDILIRPNNFCMTGKSSKRVTIHFRTNIPCCIKYLHGQETIRQLHLSYLTADKNNGLEKFDQVSSNPLFQSVSFSSNFQDEEPLHSEKLKAQKCLNSSKLFYENVKISTIFVTFSLQSSASTQPVRRDSNPDHLIGGHSNINQIDNNRNPSLPRLERHSLISVKTPPIKETKKSVIKNENFNNRLASSIEDFKNDSFESNTSQNSFRELFQPLKSQPSSQPQHPTSQPQLPSSQPQQPNSQPHYPTSQPQQPTFQPQQPTSQLQQPTFQPQQPSTQPQQPLFQPPQPSYQLAQPSFQTQKIFLQTQPASTIETSKKINQACANQYIDTRANIMQGNKQSEQRSSKVQTQDKRQQMKMKKSLPRRSAGAYSHIVFEFDETRLFDENLNERVLNFLPVAVGSVSENTLLLQNNGSSDVTWSLEAFTPVFFKQQGRSSNSDRSPFRCADGTVGVLSCKHYKEVVKILFSPSTTGLHTQYWQLSMVDKLTKKFVEFKLHLKGIGR